MNAFQRTVEQAVQRLVVQHHPVQGYVVRGSVDPFAWHCTVRVPDIHGGVGAYREYEKVPLPRSLDGVIGSVSATVFNQECGVIVGFRGSDHFPYIAQFLDFNHPVDGREKSAVHSRTPVLPQNFLTDGTGGAPARPGFDLQTRPPSHPDLPPISLPGTQPVAPAPNRTSRQETLQKVFGETLRRIFPFTP